MNNGDWGLGIEEMKNNERIDRLITNKKRKVEISSIIKRIF